MPTADQWACCIRRSNDQSRRGGPYHGCRSRWTAVRSLSLSSEERRSQANGIWMCAVHAKEVDSDDKHFTVEMLREWKSKAVTGAFDAVTTGKLVLPQGILAVDAEV